MGLSITPASHWFVATCVLPFLPEGAFGNEEVAGRP